MKQLSKILRDATASVESKYFLLPIDGGDPVYRERVYCYELYHQMRKVWPGEKESPWTTKCLYYLNGEVDKISHPILKNFKDKPDFLVHGPGAMNDNHAIIEVKQTKTSVESFRMDLKKLTRFRNKANYERAIYLIYGRGIDPEGLIKKIRKSAKGIRKLASIEIWFHQEVKEPATYICQIP